MYKKSILSDSNMQPVLRIIGKMDANGPWTQMGKKSEFKFFFFIPNFNFAINFIFSYGLLTSVVWRAYIVQNLGESEETLFVDHLSIEVAIGHPSSH